MFTIPTEEGNFVITRRQFFGGITAIGALAGISVIAGNIRHNQAQQKAAAALNVSSDAVATLSDYSEVEAGTMVTQSGSYTLPFGTLVWCTDDNVAACLVPTDQASPLNTLQVLTLGNGTTTSLLDQAQGQSQGYDIYDARLTSQGVVWTEANILADTWRIYTATMQGTTMGTPVQVDEGSTQDWETPSLAIVGDTAFWQTMPSSHDDNASKGTSEIRSARVGQSSFDTVYTATGRMSAPLYSASDGIVASPKNADSRTNTDLVHITAQGQVNDRLTLPSSMQPNEVGYGPTGFSFCFEKIYSNSSGIANLGTYTPTSTNASANYSAASYFRLAHTPLASPAWMGNYLAVKSTTTVVCVDMSDQQYCVLENVNGTTSWGDYLATQGQHSSLVTVMQIDSVDANGQTNQNCVVNVWKAQ